MKLYAMHGGMLVFKTGVNTPVTYYLIEHDSNYILFDTGINIKCKNNLANYWGTLVSHAVDVKMNNDDFIVNAIKKIGISIDDINYVVLSHLHLDHTGAIGYFPKAKYVVQKDELKYALSEQCQKNPLYIQQDIRKNVDWLQIEGDYDLLNDGTIRLIKTSGHSIGHQSMIVGNKYLLSADACNNFDVFDGNEEVTSPVNQIEADCSLNKIRNYVKKYNLALLPPHDIKCYKQLNKIYE